MLAVGWEAPPDLHIASLREEDTEKGLVLHSGHFYLKYALRHSLVSADRTPSLADLLLTELPHGLLTNTTYFKHGLRNISEKSHSLGDIDPAASVCLKQGGHCCWWAWPCPHAGIFQSYP